MVISEFIENQCRKMLLEEDCSVLEYLKKHFYKGSLNFSLKPEEINLLTWNWQQTFLNETVNSKLIKKYPMRNQFTKLFLKKIMKYLENNHEIHDDFYTTLCNVMNDSKDDFSYRHYVICNLGQIVTLKETNKMVVNGTTGMKTWDAALVLADWAICNKEKIINKNILELGSGVGFTGITICKQCSPQTIYLTDYHPEVLKTICDNIKINFPQAEVQEKNGEHLFINHGRSIGVRSLDWNKIEDLSDSLIPDIVIGADIVYDPSILKPLCNIFKTLLKRNQNLEIYIASVIRNPETFQQFLKVLDSLSLKWKELLKSEPNYCEWNESVETCILEIKN